MISKAVQVIQEQLKVKTSSEESSDCSINRNKAYLFVEMPCAEISESEGRNQW
jgi:hypothetical protein